MVAVLVLVEVGKAIREAGKEKVVEVHRKEVKEGRRSDLSLYLFSKKYIEQSKRLAWKRIA